MNYKVYLKLYLLLTIVFCLYTGCQNKHACTEKISLVVNPYKNVNWKSVNFYKANFHTHTNQSDGILPPHEVIDAYNKAGYKILSITDHSKITWPWDSLSNLNPIYENRNAKELGMLAIKGNELSGGHHFGNYFNVLPGDGSNTMRAFDQITEMNGLAMFNHPGRYWNLKRSYISHEPHSIEWYRSFYEHYTHLFGMEVINLGTIRYPNDRILWDELLTRLMPERPIWGYSNDDMHQPTHMFHSYQYMLMPSLTEVELKKAFIEGASIFVNEPKGTGDSKAPFIDSIIVNENECSISIYAKEFDKIEWKSGIKGIDSNRVSFIDTTGSVFCYKTFTKNYVRAVLTNEYGETHTQPFGFSYTHKAAVEKIYSENNSSKKPIIEWIKIPAGEFVMGSPEEEIQRIDDEIQRKIRINAFSISKFEITFEQYDLFCDATGREKPYDEGWGRDQRPVINISWNDAQAFAKWIGCRLPTEAEWEYACRAGTITPYNTGICLDNSNANSCFPYSNCEKGEYKNITMPVGSYSPNSWGLHDMHGNVFEWCNDWSGEYLPGEHTNPQGPVSGSGKLFRGGSWLDWERSCRSAYRSYTFATTKANNIGIRLCR